MKNYCFVFVICFLMKTNIYSQIPSKIWYFGDNAGINFNQTPPVKIMSAKHSINEGGVTLTDENGELLFYVDENTVYNRFNEPMKNGSGFIGNSGSSAQSPIALQDLADSTKVYLFYVSDHLDPDLIGQMRYSIVDLCGDAGKGEILENSKNILVPGKFTERITAVYNNNDNSYWIIVSDFFRHKILAYKLNEFGLNLQPIESDLEDFSTPSYIGMIVFDKSQSKLAYTCGLSGGFRGVVLGDFDINTGKVQNPEVVFTGDIYDAVFSKSGRFLYLTDIFADCNLYKLDLEDRSKDKTIYTEFGNYFFTTLEEGPDGDIYVAIPGSNSVGRISNSDKTNETFDANYFLFTGEQKVNFGLQSSYFFFGIVKEFEAFSKFGADTTICGDFSLKLHSGIDLANWSTGEIGKEITVTEPGIFFYYFRDCNKLWSDTIIINSNNVSLVNESVDKKICFGDTLVLFGFGAETMWDSGNIGPSIEVSSSGVYYANYEDECEKKLRVYNIEVEIPLTLPAVGDTTFCEDQNHILELAAPFELLDSNKRPINFNDKLILPGVYTIQGQNSCGFISQDFKIEIDRFPEFIEDTINICSTGQFPVILNTGIMNTLWNGDFTNDLYLVQSEGTYYYSVTNKCGKFDKTIFVNDVFPVKLPNIFSPNSDLQNDFFPGVPGFRDFEIAIYDRWGDLIFKGNSDWDGTNKARKVVPGVYAYILSSNTCTDYKLYGTVTLIY